MVKSLINLSNQRTYTLLWACLCLALAVGDIQATELYQYEVDGKIIFSDRPPVDLDYNVKKTKSPFVMSHHAPPAPKVKTASYRLNPKTIDPYIQTIAKRHNLSPKLVHAIIKTESNYNPKAISKKGAQGLMQIMPQTAKMLGLKQPLNPKDNIEAGVRYFKKLLDHFHGDLSLALAAYNAGPTNVEKYQGIPPFKETMNYVKKIKKDYAKGISN